MAWINHSTIGHDFRAIDATSPFSIGSGNKILYLGGGGVIANTSMTGTNYMIDFQLATTVSSGTGTGDYGIITRITSNGSFYYIWMTSNNTNIQMNISRYNSISDTFTTLVSGTPAAVSIFNTIRNIKIIMNGTSIKGYIEGVERASATDSTYTSGYVGIASSIILSGGSQYTPNTLIDNLQFTRL